MKRVQDGGCGVIRIDRRLNYSSGLPNSAPEQLDLARVVHVAGEHALHAANPVGLGRALAEFLAG